MSATFDFAELTPRGRGAVAVVSLRGPGVPATAARLLGKTPRAGVPELARITLASGERLDHGLALRRAADELELHVHGSPPLVRTLLEEIERMGGVPARSHSVEDEAHELLARAASDAAARMLLDQAEGALRAELEQLRSCGAEAWRAGIEALLARSVPAFALARPPRVVLAGPVNAGKSTLFNALLGRERVVTSDEEGTTRDAIAELAMLGAYAVELIDVAGERELPFDANRDDARAGMHRVERAGQELARALRAECDLVLWLSPPTEPRRDRDRAAAPRPPCVVLDSRGDLAGAGPGALRPREDPLGARRQVEEAFHRALGLPEAPWQPGRAAVFTQRLAEGLRGMIALERDARAAALEELLGAPPSTDSERARPARSSGGAIGGGGSRR